MADQIPRRFRVIPTFAMDKPASEPLSDEESDGLAQSAVLSGASGQSGLPTDQQVTATLGQFAATLYQTGLGGNYI